LARLANAIVFLLHFLDDDVEDHRLRPWHLARCVVAAVSAAVAFSILLVPPDLRGALLVILLVSFAPDIVIAFLTRRQVGQLSENKLDK